MKIPFQTLVLLLIIACTFSTSINDEDYNPFSRQLFSVEYKSQKRWSQFSKTSTLSIVILVFVPVFIVCTLLLAIICFLCYGCPTHLSQFNTFKDMSDGANITSNQLLDSRTNSLVLDDFNSSESAKRSVTTESRLRQLGFNTLSPFILKIMFSCSDLKVLLTNKC